MNGWPLNIESMIVCHTFMTEYPINATATEWKTACVWHGHNCSDSELFITLSSVKWYMNHEIVYIFRARQDYRKTNSHRICRSIFVPIKYEIFFSISKCLPFNRCLLCFCIWPSSIEYYAISLISPQISRYVKHNKINFFVSQVSQLH